MARVAVVTGANKGIGYGIVQGLAPLFDGHVFLTSRSTKLGDEAMQQLKKELKPEVADRLRYHQLDITDDGSVQAFKQFLKDKYGGLDVLVNNAGFAYDNDSKVPFGKQAEDTIGINYFGTKRVCEALFPLLRENARVVNVCSRAGVIAEKQDYSDAIRNKLYSAKTNLTYAELDEIANKFIKLAAEGKHLEAGYPNSTYRVSKAAEIAMTMMQHRDCKVPGVLINACCPGYVNTDMTNHKGHKTIEEGADVEIYLATLPVGAKQPNGEFYAERKPTVW